MSKEEMAKQALAALKDENEQLYNTLAWYIGCLELEIKDLKNNSIKVKIYNNDRKAWWRSDYLGYTKNKAEAGIYDINELAKNYGKTLLTFNKKANDYLVLV